MAQKEMSGWDTHVTSGTAVYPSLSNVSTPPACVTDLVKAGRTGMKQGGGFQDWTPEEVAWVDENLEGFKGRVSREEWVEQARDLAKAPR